MTVREFPIRQYAQQWLGRVRRVWGDVRPSSAERGIVSPQLLEVAFDPKYLELALGRPPDAEELAGLANATIAVPSPIFDAAYYSQAVAQPFASAAEALTHFVAVGCKIGKNPHPLIDLNWLQQPEGINFRTIAPHSLFDFLSKRILSCEPTSPYFDPGFYLETQPDVKSAGMNPHWHFWLSGVHEGRSPNRVLDLAFVAENYGPFEDAQCGLRWFVLEGDPSFVAASRQFDGVPYMVRHADVRAGAVPPLFHYLNSGRKEGREIFQADNQGAAGIDRAGERREAAGKIDPTIFTQNYERARDIYRGLQLEALARRRDDLGLDRVPAVYSETSMQEKLDILRRSGFAKKDAKISVAVPVYNEFEATVDLLHSIAISKSAKECSVYLFDDASTADFASLSDIEGVFHLRNTSNKGFLRNVNLNIKKIKSKYTILINNDAVIADDCFELLCGALEDESVSLAGPKVMYPTGVLQEAGGALGEEASTSMVGLNDSPHAPAHNFDRNADYLSGVCIAFKTDEMVKSRGLFDDRLAPAYCEDVELGLRTRSKGRLARYVHKARIWHHLSLSSNKISSLYKVKLSETNRNKIRTRQVFERVSADHSVKVFCFYLPQYHAVPENDIWWGKGFTEWTNVGRSRPLFTGHHQPRVPADLGYYNLLDPDALVGQSELASRYGVDGFIFYSYYFSGKRILEGPLQMLVQNKAIPINFCLCWANEPWTRTWDGRSKSVLLGQDHDLASSRSFIRDHRDALTDYRYIRMSGRPVIAIYRPALFDDPLRHFEAMREEVFKLGLGDPMLLAVDAMERAEAPSDPTQIGLDGSIEFPPHHMGFPADMPGDIVSNFEGKVYSLDEAYAVLVERGGPAWKHFHSAFTGWDNSPRRGPRGDIFLGDCPGKFQALLEVQMNKAKERGSAGEKAVFINAWNEWAEGTYLEPDMRYGHAWLEAVRNAKANVNA